MLKNILMKMSVLVCSFVMLAVFPMVSQANEDWVKVKNDTDKEVSVNWFSEPEDGSDLQDSSVVLQPGESSEQCSFKFSKDQSLIVFYGGYPNGDQYSYNIESGNMNQEIPVSKVMNEGFDMRPYQFKMPTEEQINDFLKRENLFFPPQKP